MPSDGLILVHFSSSLLLSGHEVSTYYHLDAFAASLQFRVTGELTDSSKVDYKTA